MGLFSLLRIFLSVLALIVSAFITVPGVLIPFTLSTFTLIISVCLLSYREAVVSVSLYLLLGLFEVVTFSKGKTGMAAFMGPTGGYLVGFLLSTILVPKIIGCAPQSKSWIREIKHFFILGLMFHGVVLVCGAFYLGVLKGPLMAWIYGVKPFFLPAIIKSFMAACTVSLCRGFCKKSLCKNEQCH